MAVWLVWEEGGREGVLRVELGGSGGHGGAAGVLAQGEARLGMALGKREWSERERRGWRRIGSTGIGSARSEARMRLLAAAVRRVAGVGVQRAR